MEQTYWNSNGSFQKTADKLRELVPAMGECENARTTNKNLDKFRRASNCYYDLYNNGLCNRAAEFRQVFGFGGTKISKSHYRNETLINELETKMNIIILAAAYEQRIVVEELLEIEQASVA